LEVQAQVALDDRADLRRRVGRGQVVDPATRGDPSGGWSVELAQVEQQHVHCVQASDRGAQVTVGGHVGRTLDRCAGVELADRVEAQAVGEGVDRRTQFVQVVHVECGQVGVAAV